MKKYTFYIACLLIMLLGCKKYAPEITETKDIPKLLFDDVGYATNQDSAFQYQGFKNTAFGCDCYEEYYKATKNMERGWLSANTNKNK